MRAIETGIATSRRAAEYHAQALIQLDAGEFAISKIVDELAAIMPVRRLQTVSADRALVDVRHALAA